MSVVDLHPPKICLSATDNIADIAAQSGMQTATDGETFLSPQRHTRE